jgi:hypothetical protein
MTSLFHSIVFTLGAVSISACASSAAEVSSSNIGKSELRRENIAVDGDVITALNVQDKTGAHILILSSASGASRARPTSGRIERIDLRATYYRKAGSNSAGPWTEEWTIKDGVDCPGLDASAAFFAKHVTVTDLNNDGVAEVTVPYKMFCGGGVDSDTVKIILRQGTEKYALRGESLVRIPGQESFGGAYKADAALSLPRNAPYQKHLLAIWKQVYIRSYP